MINFSDKLICGKKYGISRIEEQLTTLALQFSTVESVQIFVNDELMEKLRDLRA